jgi:hypothetical protein
MEACILTKLMPRSQVSVFLMISYNMFFLFINRISYQLSQRISLKHPAVFLLQIDIFVQVLQADGGNMLLWSFVGNMLYCCL